jgi:formate dehydrogenase subunit gamma
VEFSEDKAQEIIDARRSERGPMIEILHDLQDVFGYLDDRALVQVATTLNVTRAEVHGVVSFYHDFRRTPAGRTVVKICRAEACQSMGAERLVDHATDYLGIALGETSLDGAISLEQAFCLGNCALSPAVMVDDHLVGRVSDERFDRLVSEAATS